MPPSGNPFPHLSFEVVRSGRAFLHGGGEQSQTTLNNKANRVPHAQYLRKTISAWRNSWATARDQRIALNLPEIPEAMPLTIVVDENADLDFLRAAFGFEIVAEEEDGIVLVSVDDVDLKQFEAAIDKFLAGGKKSGSSARLHEIKETTEIRLERILSAHLIQLWPSIQAKSRYIVDISISCSGSEKLPAYEPQRDDESDDEFKDRTTRYSERYIEAEKQIDDLQRQREQDIERIIGEYGGEIKSIAQDPRAHTFHLPDSFTVRAEISGDCLRDLALNHPHLFQISEPDDVEFVAEAPGAVDDGTPREIRPPSQDATVVCVIDSGIEEGHRYLAPAIIESESRSFLPESNPNDVADYVAPNGHGTRVAGCILYPRQLPKANPVSLPCWIYNARILDNSCHIPDTVMPALYMEHIVRHYSSPERNKPARIFNHSINARVPARNVHMSTWGSAIDKLSFENDVLVIQSAGNLTTGTVKTHLENGIDYPAYQLEPNARIRNPGQSLNALTVGSIAHADWSNGGRKAIAKPNQPSAFSPAGEGIWGSIKPDVVEYAGDYAVDKGPPIMVMDIPPLAHEMVRATLHGPGATSRDEVGTSYAAPRVTHIAAMLANELPEESCLLYRALIANSAKWPEWAENEADKRSVIRRIGYGVPSLQGATSNSEYRVTMISTNVPEIAAREAHLYHVPIPAQMRAPESDAIIRIDVTLSYAARPRRTRRKFNGYLSTRLDWDVSREGESARSFQGRIFRGDTNQGDGGNILNWHLRENVGHGEIKDVSRQNSTLQKDWCYVPANQLPPDFCVAVVGHPGWDPSPEAKAKYALAISFEAINRDVRVYEFVRVAVETARIPIEVQERIKVSENEGEG